MRLSKGTILVAVSVLFASILVVAGYARKPVTAPPLGIEIALVKPFYIPAAAGDKTTMVVIKVPLVDGMPLGKDAVSAIKLEPKMEGEKVRVSVFALSGELGEVKTCRDWNQMKSTPVDTYIAGVDEEVSLSKLKDFGISMGNVPLTFRVVPRRTLSPAPQANPGGCECASCGGLICCPNPGYCLNCGSCGTVCCSGN